MNYFEKKYLKKNKNDLSIKESKKLQKLLSAKALSGSLDSKKFHSSDLKRMASLQAAPQPYFNIENYIHPFDTI